MKKSEYAKYIQSEHWQEFRRKVIIDAGNICEKCDMPRWLAAIAYDQDLHVHHLNYANLGHEEYTDVQVLCRRCHDIETYGRSDFRAPKRTKCDICRKTHWDVYGGLCPVCRSFMGEDLPIELRLGCVDPRDNQPIWKAMVVEFCSFIHFNKIPLEDILPVISETLRQRSELQKRIENDPNYCPF
jgi:5-methylcytosine-specific restriction endonuclease McrA